MKRLALACTVLTGASLSAQTNTFPSSGNVGIGTTSPASHLDIHDNGQHLTFLINKKLTGSWPASAEPTTMTLQSSGWSAGNLAFATGNTEWMRITPSGNIGVGTTSPSAKLHLFNSGEVQMKLQNNERQWAILSNEYWGNSGLSIYDITADTSRLQIATNGNVGIGTGATIPSHKLTVNGGGLINQLAIGADGTDINYPYEYESIGVAASWANFRLQSSNSIVFHTGSGHRENVIITPAGNVGIGTTGPGGKMQIHSDDVGSVKTYSTSNGFGLILDQYYSGASEVGASYTRTADFVANTGDVSSSQIRFLTKPANANPSVALLIGSSGNVGIGTTNPTHKLAVNGTIKAKEIIVETTGWSDYVFADDYALPSLSAVEAHIKTNKHLPGIPSAAEVATDGISLGDMQARLLAKIEELTLHQIAQQKLLNRQEALLETQSTALTTQARELDSLRSEVRTLRDAGKH